MAALSLSDTLISGAVSSILGYKSTAAEDQANATAATTSATGYTAEGGAYQTAQDIANQNAATAQALGETKALQEARALNVTLGEQKAQVAAAGFGASGSNLSLLRSSLQQGYLTQQLTATQTALTKGGYLEEAAASAAEGAATKISSDAATSLAAANTNASTTATAAAANETAVLNDYIGTNTLTADEKLLLSPLTTTGTTAATTTTDETTLSGKSIPTVPLGTTGAGGTAFI